MRWSCDGPAADYFVTLRSLHKFNMHCATHQFAISNVQGESEIPDTQLVCNEGKTGKEFKHEIRFSFLNTPSILVMLVAASER